MLVLSLALLGCTTTSDKMEDSNAGSTKETEEEKDASENNKEKSNSKDEVEAIESKLVLDTGSVETVNREIEGMDEEVEVINYHIEPYGISYQLDERFGVPEVKDNHVTYSIQDGAYNITVEIIEQTNLQEAGSNIREKFEAEEYGEKK